MPELTVTRTENRIVVVGDIRTVVERHLLRDQVSAAIEELKGECSEIVLDVAAAKYLDGFVLAQLVILARRCIDCRLTLAIEGASVELLELLAVTHIDQVLATHGTRIEPARPAA